VVAGSYLGLYLCDLGVGVFDTAFVVGALGDEGSSGS
jgi:hypothetical protein